MDANGLRFWMMADENQWLLTEDSHLQYDAERRSLRLASERSLAVFPHSETDAVSAVERIPQALDGFGSRAYWEADPNIRSVMATGAFPEAVGIFKPPLGQEPTDLTIGHDGILYMAMSFADGTAGIVMQDRRERWTPVTLKVSGFKPWRLAAAPGGGVWALDRTNRKLGRVEGAPLPARPYGAYGPSTFRPCEENSHPPRLKVWTKAVFRGHETPVAMACSPEGQLALLFWAVNKDARVRCLDENGKLGHAITLKGTGQLPYSLAWVSEDRVAVLVPGMKEAPVYLINGDAPLTVAPMGDLYPLKNHDGGPFLHGLGLPPRYLSGSRRSTPLHRLSLPSFALTGHASNRSFLDSKSAQTVWHRLYLEAAIPANCGIKVYLATSDERAAPIGAEAWQEHQFGEVFAPTNGAGIPRGAWVSTPSELPFHNGVLHCPQEKNRAGLFTVLIQRPQRRVRTLRGRSLWVRIKLFGDGRATPEVAALRAYASRFSYLNRYLPELYRETVFGPDANESGRSTQADFLERFLDNLEGVLTPLEDRIAGSYLLTDPRTAPEEALEWLGSWIGVSFDPAYPHARRRRLLEKAPELYRTRGTLEGLKLALDVVTGGAVSGGEVVVLEDFRLRRTFATILGADLADEEDPVTGGISTSGNSYVGDTLFLGDEHRKEFLALFSADLPVDDQEQAAIEALFDGLAHRVTVLVHQEVEPQDLGLIRRVVELETPAHVLPRVVTASYPFMVGAASLVGVDTYLSRRPPPQPVEVGRSHIGLRDFLQRLPSLDPRLEAAGGALALPGSQLPMAKLKLLLESPVDPGSIRPGEEADSICEYGASFRLDGSASQTSTGRRINRYIWTRAK